MTDMERRPLWEWRATRRLTKTALAAAAGVTRNTIADIENGRHQPNLATMRKIADVFNIDIRAIDWDAGRVVKTLAPVA